MLKSHAENEVGRLVPDFISFFKKALYEVKASGLHSFNIFDILDIIKNKPYITLFCWSRDMLDFDFFKKGLELVSPSHFVYDFSRKTFFMLFSINWPNFIVWCPLLFEILDNICNLFLCLWRHKFSSRFPTWSKKSEQKLKYIQNKKLSQTWDCTFNWKMFWFLLQ